MPWYNIHKVYAGLVDAYNLTGNEKAKKMLIQFSDWCLTLTANLSDNQIQEILRSEHGGMNEVFADVAAITGDKKYLKLAEKFSHKVILDPLLENKDVLNGMHANTQIPKVIGFMRVAEVSGDKNWANAANFFWKTVVDNRTISIGGNSVREHFNPSTDFSSMLESREGPETCNSYNMLKLSKHLFLADPSSKYMDYYERTTYNHIFVVPTSRGWFCVFHAHSTTPLPSVFGGATFFLVLCGFGFGKSRKIRRTDLCPRQGKSICEPFYSFDPELERKRNHAYAKHQISF